MSNAILNRNLSVHESGTGTMFNAKVYRYYFALFYFLLSVVVMMMIVAAIETDFQQTGEICLEQFGFFVVVEIEVAHATTFGTLKTATENKKYESISLIFM